MTRDEQYIIENAGSGDDLDALLATRRCADCAEFTFIFIDGLWLCQVCADERESERSGNAVDAVVGDSGPADPSSLSNVSRAA
jgi:hypothetical protein